MDPPTLPVVAHEWDFPSGSNVMSNIEMISMDQAFDKFMESAFASERQPGNGADALDALDASLFGRTFSGAFDLVPDNFVTAPLEDSLPSNVQATVHTTATATAVKEENNTFSNEAWQRLASITRMPGSEGPAVAAPRTDNRSPAPHYNASSNGSILSAPSPTQLPSSSAAGGLGPDPIYLNQILDTQHAPPILAPGNNTAAARSLNHSTMGNVESLLKLLNGNSNGPAPPFPASTAAAGGPALASRQRARSPPSNQDSFDAGMADEDTANMTTQEKNRAAQRRFRLRQKAKISNFEHQVQELSEQLKRVTSENASLKNLNNILEQVLNLRDEHINGLQQAVHVLRPGDGKRGADEITELLEEQEASSSSSGCPPQVVEQAASTQHFPEGAMFADKFPAKQMKALTFEQVVAQYKSYLANIATHMVSLEQQAMQQAQVQAQGADLAVTQNGIVGIMIELGSFCERVGMYCPVNLKRLFSHNLETLQQPDAVPMAHWVNVLSVLNLSEQQKQAILAARERMIASLAPVLAERQQLAVRLAQAAAPTTMEYVQLSKTSLQSYSVQEALSTNVLHEHNCYMEFGIFCFKKVLTLLQNARCWVHSYPFYPDRMAMANLIAGDMRAGQ